MTGREESARDDDSRGPDENVLQVLPRRHDFSFRGCASGAERLANGNADRES